MVEIAGGGDHHVARQVVRVEEGPDRRHGHLTDDFGLAQDLAPERVAREHGGGEELLDDVGRLVAVHEDLFEDHLALGVHLFGPERRPAEDVAEDVQAELDILGQCPHVKRRVLLGRVGVHVAPDSVDLFCDLAGGPFRRALEEQVLEKVRDARLLGCLVARAGPDPDAHAQRGHLGHRLAHEPDAAWQLRGRDQGETAPRTKAPATLSSTPPAPGPAPG